MRNAWLPTVSAALFAFALLLPFPAAMADTIYVDAGASGGGDGSSWTDAYTSLQDALQEARTNGEADDIWVAAGTYYPDEGGPVQAGDRTASFEVTSGIDLRGHFSGGEDALEDRNLARGAPKTILSGEIQQDGDPANNAYTVVSLEGGAVGEVRITGGQANGTGARGEGGGARVTGGTLHHAVLTGNEAQWGSALYAENSPTIEVVRATGNHATGAGTFYLKGGAASVRHVTIAENTAGGDGATGILFAGSDATVEDFAFGTETTNEVQASALVTATFDGSTLQEGQPLPGADVTIRNVGADTTVGTTTSDSNGDYTFSTSYPDDQAYTAEVTANTSEHAPQSTTTGLSTTDNTYANDFDLQRLRYDLTIATEDASTGSSVSASGAILDAQADTTITTYSTGASGQTTVTINTPANDVTSEANTTNYDAGSTAITLGGAEDRSFTTTLPPITYTFEGTVTAQGGTALSGATITLGDQDGNELATQTNSNGDYTQTATINDGLEENESVDLEANKDGYNPSAKQATADPDSRTQTTNFSLTETTVSYAVEGNVSSSDGDTVTGVPISLVSPSDNTVDTDNTDSNGFYQTTTTEDELGGDQLTGKDILIQTTGDNTVATTTTDNSGSYSVDVTQGELGGDTGQVESNPTGYNKVENTVTFQEGTNTVDLSLPLTEYTRSFDVDNTSGDPVSGASIDGDETTNGGRDVFTATTNSNGEHTQVLTIDDMIVDGDELEYTVDKDGYNPTTTTETLTDTTKTISATIEEENTTDRITITFAPKIVGDDLYSGGYGKPFDYTVSTGDTTFTTTGSTTADVPIADGDKLTISHSDSEYISTFAVNNTDTEQPPFQAGPFPDDPDYQSSNTVAINKDNVVNDYQIRAIPSTMPEGQDTESTLSGVMSNAKWTERDGNADLLGIVTTTRIDNENDVSQDVIDDVNSAYDAAQSQVGFLPITRQENTFSEVQNIFNNRGSNFAYTGIDGSSPTNFVTTSNGHAERSTSTYATNESNLIKK